jgi:hypothetical protein
MRRWRRTQRYIQGDVDAKRKVIELGLLVWSRPTRGFPSKP